MKGGQALIVLPLGVKQEFTRDAVELLGYEKPAYVRKMEEVWAAAGKEILITNYERVRDGDIEPGYFKAASLDEASVLRSFGSKTYQEFLEKFKSVKYKLVATATPSPNRYKELIHYAGYLGIMDTGQALTRFFQRDSTKANNLNRLGWTEQCKDGSKMGVGCPEYILLFRKLPTDRSNAYADEPVKKSKEKYSRGQWQLDAHGYWRSSGDRLVSKEELKDVPVSSLQSVYREYSRENVYSYQEHVELANELDKDGKLPASFMVIAPGSWNTLEVWDDINRMNTLNTTQSRRRKQMHVCPLQIDIVERVINRFSNKGDTVLDPFGGLMTVPMVAVKMGREGYGIELNPDYFRDGVGYLQAAEEAREAPTLFDFIGEGKTQEEKR
ncbi:DNA methyltransferase [Hominisplanchenecus murintestinalis]|uniref:DNA methyltransferase n=1 Tax=Hominisplanchenecus murintestinalis TaxID=2941517 RepID=UPI00203D0EA3|nr:DNA methyltransferase [Hominisplanchenecus murintestinalis]